MVIDASDIQIYGVAVSAFLATVLAVFFGLSARHTKVGLAMFYGLLSVCVFAWFGYFYHLVEDLEFARILRVISQIGIVGFVYLQARFAIVYYEEFLAPRSLIRRISRYLQGICLALLGFLFLDLAATRLIVGSLDSPSATTLAPHAGPLMPLVVFVFFATAVFIFTTLLAVLRSQAGDARRATAFVLAGIVGGMLFSLARYLPWYGITAASSLGALSFPLFTVAAFYSIHRYRLVNLQVAATQLLIFVLWTVTFFKFISNPTIAEGLADLAVFLAVLLLGTLLLRSVIHELRREREVAQLTMEKAKTEFIAVAAHQLRTPMTALRWSFNILAHPETGPLSDKQKDLVQHGNRAAENLLRVANDLLNIAQMSDQRFVFTFSTTDLATLVADTTSIFHAELAERSIELVCNYAGPVLVSCDPEKIASAVQNIMDNAIKYTPNGGTITVSVQPEGDIRPRGAYIEIKDSGIGIKASDQHNLFNRFYRGEDARRMSPDGSGLGLSIVKMIVDGHGGRTEVLSAGEHGTIVRIHLDANPAPGTQK
jgi:signal transduction histidine kinase